MTWTSVNAAANGFSYDAAGNVLSDGVNQYLYDAEGRLCAVANTPVAGTTSMTGYLYGADGARVAKGAIGSWSCNPAANGFTAASTYVPGQGGEQLSELSGSGAWAHTNLFAGGKLLATYSAANGANDIYFALTNWLGSKRAEIAPDKKYSTFFSLPYGNGLIVAGDAADATEHHFTGERDTESGNDYFGARYYASSFGRFMSPASLREVRGEWLGREASRFGNEGWSCDCPV